MVKSVWRAGLEVFCKYRFFIEVGVFESYGGVFRE